MKLLRFARNDDDHKGLSLGPGRARYARLSETTRNYVFFLAALVAIAAAAVRFSTPSLA
jgi:hypothetical protein